MRRGASHPFPDLRVIVILILILILIVIVIVILFRVSLVQPVIGVGLDQANHHRNDAPQAVLSRLNFLPRTPAFGHQDIQSGRAFQSRATRVVKVSATIRSGKFPIPFGNVERDGSAGPVQLVGHRKGLGQLLQDRLKSGDESQGCLVNLQLFMVESAVHGITITITITSTSTSRKTRGERSEMRPTRAASAGLFPRPSTIPVTFPSVCFSTQ